MKNLFCALLVLLIFTTFCFGQGDKTPPPAAEKSWTRIGTDDKEISVALPSDFLVDATTKTRDQAYRIFGFQNGVLMEMRVSQPDSPKRSLSQITDRYSENAKVSSFNFNGVAGKSFVSKNDRYYNSVDLAFEDNFYVLSVRAANENKAEADRFLCSIKVRDKPLYTCKEKFPEPVGETVLLSSLATSPKISEALNRKPHGEEGKISYELEAKGKAEADKDEARQRPAIILERGAVRPVALRVNGNIIRGAFKIKFRAMLLANGRIGDVTVLSNLDKDYVKKFVEAARKSKFIPAEIDGQPVDSEYTFSYTVETF